MICTFGDTTDVVWWRELQLPDTHRSSGWDGRLLPGRRPTGGLATSPTPMPRYGELAGKTVKQAQARIVELLRRARRADRRDPKPITHPVKFYERGDRPLEIVTTRQWYIRNGGRDPRPPRRRSSRGRASCVAPRRTCAVATRTGSRASTATGSSAVSASSACRSRCGTALDDSTARSRLRPADRSRRGRAAGRPVSDAPAGYAEDQRGKAGGFIGRSRRDGHLGHVVAHPRDRRRLGGRPRPLRPGVPDGPAPAGARDHPHLAVLDHRCCDRTSSSTGCRGPTPRSPAGSSTPTARRCRRARATSSRPIGARSASSAPTPCATGRRAGGRASTPRSTRAR